MRGPWGTIAVGAAVAALFGVRWLALTTADRAWAASLGAGTAHADIALLRAALGAGAFTVAAAWYVGNLLLLYRQIGAVQVPRQVGDLDIVEHVPRRYLLAGVLVIGAVLGAVSSRGAGDWWMLRALADVSLETAGRDPLLDRPIGYYLFTLPWDRALQRFALGLALVGTVLLALLYTAVGAIRRQERRLEFLPFARWHLAALSGTLALALAWGFAQEPALLVGGYRGVAYDAVLRDVRIPMALVLTVAAIVVAAASLVWMRVDRVRIPGIAWATLLGTVAVGRFIVPPAAAAAWGREGRAVRELTQEADRARRDAFLLGGDTVPLTLALPDAGYANQHTADLQGAPVWDADRLTQVLNRVAARPAMGRFYDASLMALPQAGGTPLTVFLAAREPLDSDPSPGGPGAGGVVAVLGSRAGPGGAPLFLPVLARPDSTVATPADLVLEGDETWFSRTAAGHVVLTAAPPIGVPVRGAWRRIALAWALQSPGLLSARRVPAGSVVVAERAVADRLARYAPFATFGAVWPAVIDGRLLWAAWGYVAREIYPFGSPVAWRRAQVRYLRAGFVGTVDAATGATSVYLAREADPVSVAWRQVLPDLVKAPEQLPPALVGQLRYPEELFGAQVRLLRGLAGRARVANPYWWVGTAPGDTVIRLRLRLVDEVYQEPRVAAVIEGVLDRGRPGVRVLRYHEPYVLAGPSEIAREFAGAAPSEAAAPGALVLAPLDDGTAAFQSFYDSTGAILGVVAGWPGAVGRGATALDALRHASPRADSAAARGATPLDMAREWFRRLDRARAEGNWTAFGVAWDGLRAALGLSPGEPRVAPPQPRD
jgi:uncharacterized protein